jgi:hypothetical protein
LNSHDLVAVGNVGGIDIGGAVPFAFINLQLSTLGALSLVIQTRTEK